MTAFVFITLSLSLCQAHTQAAAAAGFVTVSAIRSGVTDEDLRIELDGDGGVQKLHAGPATFASKSAGLFVRDGAAGEPMPAGLGASKDRVTVLEKAGLRVTARIEPRPGHLLVTGGVEDMRRAADRSADVIFRLPFAPAVWWASISEKIAPDEVTPPPKATRNPDTLPEGAAVLEKIENTGRAQNFNPIACVTTADESAGLAVALPPDAPCRFRFAHLAEEGVLELRLEFGLSQAASGALKGRAPFRFIIYPADGHWGLRDALRRYYAMFPAVFERRTQARGLWLVSMPPLKDVTDPEHYAFWQATRLSETPLAIKMGLAPCPYTSVGQRELGYLKQKVNTYEEVLAVLKNKPETTHKSRYTWEEVKPLVENSGLVDRNGRLTYRLRETEWAGNGVSFPTNPSPFLPTSTAHPSVAAHTFAEVDSAIHDWPATAGLFVDSLSMWGSYENYRRDHFAAARAPLSHDAQGRVTLPNWMPHMDFLHELHRRIGDRFVFANGSRPGRAFCVFELDVPGMENSLRDLENRNQSDFVRAMAATKPVVCLLNYPASGLSRDDAEQYVQRFTALGLAPEIRRNPWGRYQDRDADLYSKFMSVYRRIDRAGWQPVTHAQTDHDAVWIERFGSGQEIYFTLFNPTDAAIRTRVTVDISILSLKAAPWEELLTHRPHDPASTIAIPAKSLRVIHLARP